MTDPALPSAHAPRRRPWLATPTRAGGLALVVAATLVALAVLRPTAAAPVAPAIRPDGLGTVSYGQDKASAVAALTEALGAPTYTGPLNPPYGCNRGYQDIRWRDLTVSFVDMGAGLRVSGYFWGNILNRNAPTAHTPMRGPGSPLVGNPWGLRIGTSVPSADALVARLRRTYPDAQFGKIHQIYDSTTTMTSNGHRINIILHPRWFGGYQVEAIWSFTIGEMPC